MRRSILTIYLATLLPTAALGQVEDNDAGVTRQPGSAAIALLDENGDGLLSAIEFSEGRRLRFERLDENGDGLLSIEEMSQMNSERLGKGDGSRMYGRMDQDNSGTLTPDEFQLFGATMFARRDQNQDGFLSAEEQTGFGRRPRQTNFDDQSPQ